MNLPSDWMNSINSKDVQIIALTIAFAGLCGVLIAVIYRLSHSRAVCSYKMAQTLVIFTIISSMMLFLKFSAGIVAVIGAVTVMRFRDAVKDHRDIVYLFWAVVTGFACAAHQFVLVGIGTFAIVLVLALTYSFRDSNRVLVIVRGQRNGEETVINEIMRYAGNKIKMCYNHSTDEGEMELIYEVKKKEGDRFRYGEKMQEMLYQLNEVEEVNILYQPDDMRI